MKRNRARKKHNSAIGEFGVLYDPKTVSIHSIQKPNGKWVKANGRNVGLSTIIDPEYLIAAPDDFNPHNTIAYRMAEMLFLASNLYGLRDTRYTFAGVEFTSGRPRTRFCLGKNVIIQLHTNTLFDRNELLRQLAHESIHLLAPFPERPVKIIEEGMAEAFAFVYMRDTMKVIVPPPQMESYREAVELVSMLLSIDPYGIKRLREDEPIISNITKSLILKHYPRLDEGAAARLTRTFIWDGCDDPDILAFYDNEHVR